MKVQDLGVSSKRFLILVSTPEVSPLLSNFKDEIQQKFETMNNRLKTIKNNIKPLYRIKPVRV